MGPRVTDAEGGTPRLPVARAGRQALAYHGGGGVLAAVAQLLLDVPLARLAGPRAQDVHPLLHLGSAGTKRARKSQEITDSAFPNAPSLR